VIDILTDPLTRGPFWASLILSVLLSIIGVMTFFSRKPLLGEVMAHCSYPGAILGLMLSIGFLGFESPSFVLFMAFIISLIGSLILRKLEDVHSSDSSMTLVLSGFFGLGVVLSSVIQQAYPKFYRLAQSYLFGQISTMTDSHILAYSLACIAVIIVIFIFFSHLKLRLFDPMYSEFLHGKKSAFILEVLTCFCLVIGIRGVGVVLVSSFFVSPAIFTMRYCKTFKASLILASLLAASLNTVAFLLPFKAPIGPLIVLLLSMCSLLNLKKRPLDALH